MYTPPPTPSSLCALLWSTNTQEMLPLVTMLGPQRSQRPIYLYVPVHWMTTVCVVGNEFNPKVWCSSLAEDEWNEPTSRSNFHYQKKVKKKTFKKAPQGFFLIYIKKKGKKRRRGRRNRGGDDEMERNESVKKKGRRYIYLCK